jgi:hypothetical protein
MLKNHSLHVSHLVIVLLLFLFVPHPAHAGGWSWKTPPNAVTLESGRRNPIFYVGEPIVLAVKGKTAVSYQLRDYYGTLVAEGKCGALLAVKPLGPGWYKVSVYGEADQGLPWGKIVGGTNIAVFRRDPHFPPLSPKDAPGGGDGIGDQPTRDVIGMGPERLSVPDAGKPEEAIQKLEGEIAIDKKLYLPYDPLRKRVLMVSFPNGTKDLDGVRQIVTRFQNDVAYWEPRNEPNGGSSGAAFAVKEMKPFYDTVKAVNPTLKVLGPGTVGIAPAGNMLGWLDDFFQAGGGKSIDAFSFHAYNTVNGDVEMARFALSALQKLLAKHGLEHIEKWQTEQGYFAAVYGAYQPRLQGRWTMDQMMVYEQYGIPKEHNHYWYDLSHGFWDFPTWWENEDRSLNPAASLLRVWSEELYGTNFQKAYDFGPAGNAQYLGDYFTGPGKRIAAFLSAGDPHGKIDLIVSGGQSLQTISPFGAATALPVTRGHVTLPVSELPVYVELSAGQTISVAPMNYGPNLARLPGVVIDAAGSVVERDKLHNGQFENWYYSQIAGTGPWTDGGAWDKAQAAAPPADPLPITLTLPAPRKIARVIVYAAPPWQSQSTLLDFELQYEAGGVWKTLRHVQEPTKTFPVYSPNNRTTVDSFFSDRWVFPLSFPPVTTRRLRLLIHDATFGGGATKEVTIAGGQTGPRAATLREIEVYGK